MTKIEWTEKTWNPISGCTKVSAGCAHCYAADVAKRFWGDRPFSAVQFHPERILQPLRRKKSTMYFVNSMSDLFHDAVDEDQLDQIFAVMALTPHHTYQVLTKRPGRMLEYFGDKDLLNRWARSAVDLDVWEDIGVLSAWTAIASDYPPPNVWMGVSVENQKTANERIPLLLETPAAVRFLSCEPLLEHVDLNPHVGGNCFDWVIVGGESGHKARPFSVDWARSIVAQCRDANVPVFVKQLGGNADYPVSGKGGDMEQWPEDLRIREMP